MTSLEDQAIWNDADAMQEIGDEILRSSTDDIIARTRLLESDVRIMSSEFKRLTHEQAHMREKIKDNREKIRLNRQLPYLVGHVVELLDASTSRTDGGADGDDEVEEDEDDVIPANHTEEGFDSHLDGIDAPAGAGGQNGATDQSAKKQQTSTSAKRTNSTAPQTASTLPAQAAASTFSGGRKSAVVKTSTRQTIYLPMVGLVCPSHLKPGDLVGVNKDSYLILDKLPPEYDARVKAMEVDEKPTEDYGDIGGLDKQIEELVEAIVLPMTQQERFDKLGIKSPKGVLMYGPPGTGKTLLARACAAQTRSTFLKLAGPQLVQMFIGDGAKLVRDAFALAREKQPSIIFIDEIDAVGTKRFDSQKSGDREVQRTMLELLNQLDGFSSSDNIKVIAATNRIDILDPALLRSGRLDRKIEFPHPNEEARARIIQIHSRKMTVSPDVNYDELARSCDEFNGAQCKAVCVEAGMIALRRTATTITHEDFMEGILEVQAKKKTVLQYYA